MATATSSYKYTLILFFSLLVTLTKAQNLLPHVQFFSTSDGLSDRTVYSVIDDEQGLIWLGTGHGLQWYDGHDFHSLKQDSISPTGAIEYLFPLDHDQLLVQTEGPIHYLFSTAERRFLKQLLPKEVDAYQALSDTLYPQLKQNQFFIELNLKDPQTPISQFLTRKASSDEYHSCQLTIKGKPLIIEDFAPILSPRIAIHIDTLGRHWLASQNRLWLFDNQGRFLLDLSQKLANQLSTNWNPSSIYIDSKNHIWLCSNQGIFLIELKESYFHNYFDDENNISIRGIYELSPDRFLVGTYQGTRLLNTEQRTFIEIGRFNFGLNFTRGPDSIVWAGLHGKSFLEIDLKNLSHRLVTTSHISPSEITTPYWDSLSQCLFLGTNAGLYLSTDRGKTLSPYPIVNEFKNFMGSSCRFIKAHEDAIWIAGTKGLFRLDREYGVTDHFSYDHFEFRHFHVDHEGIFWIATNGGGLIKWNPDTDETRQFTTLDGLTHNVLYAVLEDEAGFFWISSNKGLMRFDPRNQDVISFQPEDGITHEEFNSYSYLKTSDGRFFFGGLAGITAFHPQDLQPKVNESVLLLTQLQQLDGSNGELIDKTHIFKEQQEVRLRPGDKFFTLRFSLLDYSSSDQVYAWRIEGLDSDWNYQTDNSLRIHSLPYGNHVLHIKAKSSGGQWAKQELTIPILAISPFYLRWSFFLFSLMGLLIVSYTYLRWRLTQLHYREQKLNELIGQRTIELSEKNQELAQINRMKDQLFALISHDLRSPLLALRGISRKVNFLIQKGRTEELAAMGHSIEEAATSTSKLLDNLLNWAMIQGGRFPYHPTRVIILDLGLETLSLYKNIAETKQINLSFDCPQDIQVFADPAALAVILRNLLDNAIKFTKPGGQVILKVQSCDKWVSISCQDNGRGIAADLISDLFQLDSRRTVGTLGEKGTGLGLQLCKELTEMNGGQINVESELGKGSQFTLSFQKHKKSVTDWPVY